MAQRFLPRLLIFASAEIYNFNLLIFKSFIYNFYNIKIFEQWIS